MSKKQRSAQCANSTYLILTVLFIGPNIVPSFDVHASDTGNIDPATLKIEDLIMCNHDVPTWYGFSIWFQDNNKATASLGMTPMKSTNIFLSQYRLSKPVTVFGRQTSRIAFGGDGPLAVLDSEPLEVLAAELGVTPVRATANRYLGAKIVVKRPFDGGSPEFQGTKLIQLNVSKISDMQGKLLVGCSYQLLFDEN